MQHDHHVYQWRRWRHHLTICQELFRNLRWYPSDVTLVDVVE